MAHTHTTQRSGRGWGWPLLVWLVTRAGLIALWLAAEPVLGGDVSYYFTRMHQWLAEGLPVAQTMPEYPTPVLWLLLVPYLLSGQTLLGFQVAFVAIMLALDLALAGLLWARGRGRIAVWFWIGFVVAIGPIAYLRLDLLPAVAVAVSLILLGRGADRSAGVLLAAGAGLKLWPAMIYPITFTGRRRRDHLVTIAFFGVGVALVVAALLFGGWGRLVSPLQWQSGRGLQIESVWATVPMLGRAFDPNAFAVVYSPWQAFEIFGPGVPVWLSVASIVSYLGYAAIAVGYLVWFRARYRQVFTRRPKLVDAARPATSEAVAWAAVAVITVTLIANKTFSPQYLTWLGAAVAALLLLSTADSPLRRSAGITAVATLGLAAVTQLIYPLGYNSLLGVDELTPAVTVALAVRNLGVLVLGGWLISRLPAAVALTSEAESTADLASSDL